MPGLIHLEAFPGALIESQGPALAQRVTELLKAVAPVNKNPGEGVTPGRFRDSLNGRAEGYGDGLLVTVYADDPKAPFVIHDTAPHPIEPHLPPWALRFTVQGGAVVFAKHVDHPGTTGQEFWLKAEEEIRVAVEEVVSRAFAEAAAVEA